MTSGKISIYGYDVRHQLPQIRRVLGVCPQHNILYDRYMYITKALLRPVM